MPEPRTARFPATNADSSDSADPTEAFPKQYDETIFLVGGRSTGPGDMERCDFKIHENYLAWGRRLIESGRFLLQSKSDIARLGFVLACRWLDSLEPDAIERSIMHQIAQMEEVIAWEMRQVRYVKFIDAVSKMITEQLALPHGKLQVARVLRKMQRHINRMEESFYKTHFERMFEDRFGLFRQAGILMLDAQEGAGPIEEQQGGAEQVEQEHEQVAFWESDEVAEVLLHELGSNNGDYAH